MTRLEKARLAFRAAVGGDNPNIQDRAMNWDRCMAASAELESAARAEGRMEGWRAAMERAAVEADEGDGPTFIANRIRALGKEGLSHD